MVVIINLEVRRKTDVPMVFEVIDDRGVRLQPYEILKGKLLGQIDKSEVDSYADNSWDEAANSLETKAEDEVDTFFRSLSPRTFLGTRKQGQTFDGPYHRIMFDTSTADENALKLRENTAG